MTYSKLKDGDRIEMEVLIDCKLLRWVPGTVYENKDNPFFIKRARLDNGMDQPIMEHRMKYVRKPL